MRNSFIKKILASGVFVLALFFPVNILAAPTAPPTGGESYLKVDASAPVGSLQINSSGAIFIGLWRGANIGMLYGGTGASVANSAAVGGLIGAADSPANTNITSFSTSLNINPTSYVGISLNGATPPATTPPAPPVRFAIGEISGSVPFVINDDGDITRIKNVTYSWPSANSSSGQLLKNDGSGNLYWEVLNPTGAVAGWKEDTSIYTYNTGRSVGIGTASPTGKLTIKSSGTPFAIRNAADSADIFAIGNAGKVITGSVPWTPALSGLPVSCPPGQFIVSVGTAGLVCDDGIDSPSGWTENVAANSISQTTLTRKVGIGRATPAEELHLESGSTVTTNPLTSLAPVTDSTTVINAGYRFSPLVDGQITQLGARCDAGQRTVTLYDNAGATLNTATIVNTGSGWTYSSLITPRDVFAGQTYIVAVTNPNIPTGKNSCKANPFTTPVILGGVVIHEGRWIAGSAFPTTVENNMMRGYADITFVAVDTAQKRFQVDGSLGIGGATPSGSTKLAVGGVVESKVLGLKFPDGNIQTTPAISGSGSSNAISVWSASRTLSASGITDSGTNVGIGVSLPSAKLDIINGLMASYTGTVTLSGSLTPTLLGISGITGSSIPINGVIQANFFSTDNTKSAIYGSSVSGSGIGLTINQAGTGDIARFKNNGSTVVLMQNDGKVGISDSAISSAAAQLEVTSQLNSVVLRKTTGAGSVRIFPGVGDATSRTGTALCNATSTSTTSICLAQWSSTGASSASTSNPLKDAGVTVTNIVPSSRNQMSCIEYSSKIYCFGGQNSAGTALDKIIEYTPSTNTVAIKSAVLPSARHSLSCAEKSGLIYCFGGIDNGGTVLSQIISYNPSSDTVSTLSHVLPSARYGLACADSSVGSYIYCFGGINSSGTYLTEGVQYTVGTGVNSAGTIPGSARAYLSCAENSASGVRKIYCFGGVTSSGTSVTTTFEYNPVAGYSTKFSLPSAKARLSCAEEATSHLIYCTGGNPSSGTYSNEILQYNSATDRVEVKLDTLPSARAGHSCAGNFANRKIYCFGGLTSGGKIKEIVEYYPITDTMVTRGVAFSSGRSDLSCARDSSNNKIYCFGGLINGGLSANQITEYSAPPSESLTVKSSTLFSGRYGYSCAEDSSSSPRKIYCFGGNEILEYIPSANTIATKTATFPNRYYSSCVENSSVSPRAIYCFGGIDGHPVSGTLTRQILKYVPSTDTLTTETTLLTTASKGIGCAEETSFSPRRIYCFGGEANGFFLNSIIYYVPSSGTLSGSPGGIVLPTDRGHLSCVENTATHRFYCFGGEGPSSNNQVVEYNPATDTLVTKFATFSSTRTRLSCGLNPSVNKIYCFGGTPNPGGTPIAQIAEYSLVDEITTKLFPLSGDDYNMGYSFTPAVNGQITELGLRCTAGSRTVTLYNQSDNSVITSVSVNGSGINTWVYEPITPVNVYAGSSYVVAVRNTVANDYCYGNYATPAASGGVTINDSRYIPNSAAIPTTTDTVIMFGQADVTFLGNSCVSSMANARALCADFKD